VPPAPIPQPDPHANDPFHFDGWELLPRERLLRIGGEKVDVGDRAFDVLVMLVRADGALVSREQLLDAVWAGLVVEENNLSVQVAALRKRLPAGCIGTAPGRGYRLTAVRRVVPDEAQKAAGAAALIAEVPAADRPAASDPAQAAGAAPGADTPIGREQDLLALQDALARTAVLTLTGTGGVGKTTLARALTRRCQQAGMPVHWVDLAPLAPGAEARQLDARIARALGIELDDAPHAREDLLAALSRSGGLVVLDNAEHVLDDTAGLLEAAVASAPGLRWLVTSQAPLRVSGEQLWRLEPLAAPPPGTPLAEATRWPALALLLERVQAADRGFVLDAAALEAATELTRQLDGLPLALELAAAQVAALGPEAVRSQLNARLALLQAGGQRRGPARQMSLKSTLDWSHSLLDAHEQRVLRRLAVFPAAFAPGMAAALAADETEAPAALMPVLAALVDKSLLQRTPRRSGAPGEAPRLALFASLRAYAHERLADAGETARWQQRHAELVADWFDRIATSPARERDASWIAATAPERDNVRAALAWAIAEGTPPAPAAPPALLARLVTALAQIDAVSHRAADLLQWPLPLPRLLQAPARERAAACVELSWAHYAEGNRETGTELGLRALADYEALGDDVGVYRSLAQLARLYESRPGRLALARQAWARLQALDASGVPLAVRLRAEIFGPFHYERIRSVERIREIEALAAGAGLDGLARSCRVLEADLLLVQRRFAEAAQLADGVFPSAGPSPREEALLALNRAQALLRMGQVAAALEAASLVLRSLPAAAHLVADAFAWGIARAGHAETAALLAGYGQRVRRERDEDPDPAEAEMIADTLALLRSRFDEVRCVELMQTGASMPLSLVLKHLHETVARIKEAPLPRDGPPKGIPGRAA
jgi:predicted ATPase/DNA-binding winged helix-turn-helix (wHTH) protein